MSATTGIFSNLLQANSSVNTSNASIVHTLYANVVQANSSVNTSNISITGTVYTNTLVANTFIRASNINAVHIISSNTLNANLSLSTPDVFISNTIFGNIINANTVNTVNAVANFIRTDSLESSSNVITGTIFTTNSLSDNFEANVAIITPTITVDGLTETRILQATSSTNTSNSSVFNTSYTKYLIANNSISTADASVSGRTSTNVLQANTSANTQVLSVSERTLVNVLQANTSVNTSNASVVNTTYTNFLVANSSISAPTAFVSAIVYTDNVQANNSANTQTLSVSQLIDANSASAFVNNLSVQSNLSIGGNFVINGTTVYNSNTFTINNGTNTPQISYFEVNRGTGSTNAAIRWNETSKFFDTINVSSNSYYRILTNEQISASLTSTSSTNVASSAVANTLNNTITAANTFLQAAVASAGSYANSGFGAANTADTKAVNSGLYANGAFIKANAAFLAANNVAPQIEPAFSKANSAYAKANSVIATINGSSGSITANSGGITFNSNNGISIDATGANTLTVSTPQDLRTTASPSFASLSLTSPLTASQGGTGASSLSAAFTNMVTEAAGSGTTGYSLVTGGPGNYYWAPGGTGGGGGATPGTTIVSSRLSYSGDSSNNKFTTPTFNNNTQLRAYINGVRQLDSEYSANSSNSKIIFSTAPATGDTLLVEVDGYAVFPYYANNITYGPSTGSISGSANTIQLAIDDIESRKIAKSGGTITGIVLAPTMNANTSNTALATTEFVKNVLNDPVATSGVTYAINTSGNAGTVTNGIYTSVSYANPSWITSLATSKLSGTVGDSNLAEKVTATSTGTAAQVSRFTVDSKGRITSANSVAIAIPTSQITNFPTLAASATTDTTNAGNIISGTLANARLAATGVVANSYGGANKVAQFTVNDRGVITGASDATIQIQKSQISDFPNFAASALTDTTNASNITSGILNAARLPATYAAITGAGFTGEVSVTNGQGKITLSATGDISAYRSGGTTGVIYLSSSGTKYLYNDGSNYYLPGQNLIVNGASVLTAVSGGTITSVYNFKSSQGVAYGGQSGTLAVLGSGVIGDSASMSFHRPGAYAINMGLDADNVFRIGGWSDGAQYRFTADTAGNFIARGNVTAYSDARLKTNVKTIENALDTVGKMRGVTYERIDSGEKGVGVIAQEMKEILPEVVMEAASEQEFMSVSYGNIVGVLIEAIKELKAEIEVLKGQK
jgi:hypothetical protein